jgi:hypothetical protein
MLSSADAVLFFNWMPRCGGSLSDRELASTGRFDRVKGHAASSAEPPDWSRGGAPTTSQYSTGISGKCDNLLSAANAAAHYGHKASPDNRFAGSAPVFLNYLQEMSCFIGNVLLRIERVGLRAKVHDVDRSRPR